MDRINKSQFSGVMIIAGGVIGAGMFSLPVVSSGMWLWYSIACLVMLWLLNYWSALYILEANVQFEPGASFDTIVANLLGKKWNVVIGVALAFLMYILLYAYFSAFGNMATQMLGLEMFNSNQWLQGVVSLWLGSVLAMVVWWSTNAVGRISSFLVTAMVISFVVSMFGYTFQIDTKKLFNINAGHHQYFIYLWAALPYVMTSFGFSTLVPSLYKYYGKNIRAIKNSLFGGSLLAFLVYVFFIVVVFGNISRQEFIAVNAAGGNIGDLVQAFGKDGTDSMLKNVLQLFSNFAIISSFLSVGLGLFDFIADKFSFENNRTGRFKTMCFTFLPPGIASFFFPKGFIAAIGFAGLVLIFALCVAPFFMIRKVRAKSENSIYRVAGGKLLLFVFLALSLLVGVCKILTLMDVLPQW